VDVRLLAEADEPVMKGWFLELPAPIQIKWRVRIEMLQQYGTELGAPFVQKLEDGLFALNCDHNGARSSLLFVEVGNSLIVCFPVQSEVISDFELRRLQKTRERLIAFSEPVAPGGPNEIT
jgi:hypothetical protein